MRRISVIALLLVLAANAFAEDRWAVVIGIDDYQDLGKLTTARNDAKSVAKALLESGGFAENRLALLVDDAARPQDKPTLANMQKRIAQFAGLAEAEDTLLVFFSGHGVTKDGKGYLVPMDGDQNLAVPLEWVSATLKSSKAAHKILILDACHAGAAAKGVAGIAPSLVSENTGTAMLLSCAADQVSYPDEPSGNSVFTKYLVAGLSGAADASAGRRVTLDGLYGFVRARMKDWAVETGKTQTPQMVGSVDASVVLAIVPDIPTLSVRAVDAQAGSEITGADVFVNGQKAGPAPLSGFKLEKGASVTVEVKGDKLTAYKETLVAARAGANVITARLTRITIQVPPGFHAKDGTTCEPYSNTGWAKEVVHDKTGIEMVFIPAGEFQMGSPDSEPGRENDEGPVHAVRITRPFYLGKYEVTQGEWQKVMGNNPSNFKGDRNPVEVVSWNDCEGFLSRSGDGLALPTEAEWEYACRAGSATRFSFGDSDGQLGDYAWYSGNSGNTTHPVGEKQPNAWGLYDMHGNVWEWCADWNGSYAAGSADDPTGPSSGASRVLRGGSWGVDAQGCRSAYRLGGDPADACSSGGLRVRRGL